MSKQTKNEIIVYNEVVIEDLFTECFIFLAFNIVPPCIACVTINVYKKKIYSFNKNTKQNDYRAILTWLMIPPLPNYIKPLK